MIKVKFGRKYIGLFSGAPYGDCDERLEDYQRNDCNIKRNVVQRHLDSLEGAYTSAPTFDITTGERFLAGFLEDGMFMISTDFARYFEQGKVEIPIEYEMYLQNILTAAE